MKKSVCLMLVLSLSSFMYSADLLPRKQVGGWLDEHSEAPRTFYTPPVETGPSVSSPASGDSWVHGRRVVTVEWNDLEGSLVKLYLFRGNDEIALLSGWIENESRYRNMTSIEESWGSGDGFYVVVEDNLGNTLNSEEFSLRSDLQIQDSVLGPWAVGQQDVRIFWDGAQGTSVRIALEKDDEEIAVLCDWELNQGSFLVPFSIPSAWGIGDGYRLHIEDNLGNSDLSRTFRIQSILVFSPESGESWTVGDTVPEFRWIGAHNVVRIFLRSSGREVAVIAGWMDNAERFSYAGVVPSAWAPERSAAYELVVQDDLGEEGVVYPVQIGHTDDTVAGAMPLVSHGSDFIEAAEDIDYWFVEAIRGNKYKVTASDTVTVTLQVFSSNGTNSVTEQAVGEVAWQASRTGEYIIKVASKLGATGSYSLSFGRAFGVL